MEELVKSSSVILLVFVDSFCQAAHKERKQHLVSIDDVLKGNKKKTERRKFNDNQHKCNTEKIRD